MLYITGLYALNTHLPHDETIGDWHPQYRNQPPETRNTSTSILDDWHVFPLDTPIKDINGNLIHYIADHRRAALDMIEQGQLIPNIKHDCLDSKQATRDMMQAATKLYATKPSTDLDKALTYHYRADWLLAKGTKPTPKQRKTPMKKDKTTLLNIITKLNKNTNAPVLKGGNAIVLLYGEPRWSTNLNFDHTRGWKQKEQLKTTITKLCEEQQWTFRLAKDTDTVTRFMIRESPDDNNPLKIEISHRYDIPTETTTIQNIKTYQIPILTKQKINVYLNRDRIRDLQDITYLLNTFPNEINTETIDIWHEANERKPFDEQFDYLWLSQADALTSQEWSSLAQDVLNMQKTIQHIQNRIDAELNNISQQETTHKTTEKQSRQDSESRTLD